MIFFKLAASLPFVAAVFYQQILLIALTTKMLRCV